MIVVYVILFILLGSATIAGISAAPWVPTRKRDRAYLIERLDLAGKTVIDFGCGDGSMLFDIARAHPEVKAIGYDISLIPLFLAWARKLLNRQAYRNVNIRFGNLFTADISKADVIFVFLMSRAYDKLSKKLSTEIAPTATLALEAWPLPHVPITQTIKGEKMLSVYIYKGENLRKV